MIKLSKKSYILLKKVLKSHRPELIPIVDENEEFSDEFYNELRDIIGNELIANGLNGDEPTAYGLELEDLIDEVGRLFLYK